MALGLKNGTVVVWNVYRGENFALKFTSLERFTGGHFSTKPSRHQEVYSPPHGGDFVDGEMI